MHLRRAPAFTVVMRAVRVANHVHGAGAGTSLRTDRTRASKLMASSRCAPKDENSFHQDMNSANEIVAPGTAVCRRVSWRIAVVNCFVVKVTLQRRSMLASSYKSMELMASTQHIDLVSVSLAWRHGTRRTPNCQRRCHRILDAWHVPMSTTMQTLQRKQDRPRLCRLGQTICAGTGVLAVYTRVTLCGFDA